MYEDEAIKNKKDIVLDLSDTEATAKICKALSSETRLEILKCLVDKSMTISELAEAFYLPMSSMCLHIKTLSEANLITVVPKPGLRGSQKLCGIKTANVTLDIFAHLNKLTRKPPVYVNMPIGHYSDCHILPPCGIASAASYVYYEDSPYGFYSPDRTDAALIWLTSGFLEYQFSNYPLQQDKVTQIEFSFEICSEAPGYNNNWPIRACAALSRTRNTIRISALRLPARPVPPKKISPVQTTVCSSATRLTTIRRSLWRSVSQTVIPPTTPASFPSS